jgi:hypothetical protein
VSPGPRATGEAAGGPSSPRPVLAPLAASLARRRPVTVGTCFGCGERKPALAALLVRERHERLALCAACLRDACAPT